MRNSEVSANEISICNAIEKMAKHVMHYLPCSDTDDVINLLPKQLRVHTDVKLTSLRRQSANVLITIAGNSIYAMVTDLWHHFSYNSRGAWQTVYAMLPSNYE